MRPSVRPLLRQVARLLGHLGLLLAVLLLVAPGAGAGEEGEGTAPAAPAVRPYEGLLPVPDPARNVSPGGDVDADVDFVAVRIVDRVTGKPLPGARLRCFDEDISGFCLRYAPSLAVAKADAQGFAWIPLPDGLRPDHWVADLPGHAPEHAYGLPKARMALAKGVDVTARLLDAHGRPLEGVEVEWWLGCPHGPALGQTRTGADGVFTFQDVNTGGDVWFFAPPGSLASLEYDVSDLLALGSRRVDVVLPPGIAIQGRVVDPEGRGREGVVVRADDGTRGPAVATAVDGTFHLAGVEAGAPLFLFDPLRPDAEPARVEGATGDTPLRLVLGPEGLVVEDVPLVALSVSVRDAGGQALDGVCLFLIGEDGGPVGEAATGPDGDPAIFDVPGGSRARLVNATPFGPWSVEPQSVVLPVGEDTEIERVGRKRLPLVVEGPSSGVLASQGYERYLDDADPSPFLDPEVEAAVRWGSVVVPVGPPEAGVRRVRYARPPRHTIRLRGSDLGDVVHLFLPGLEETTWLDGDLVAGAFETRAAGPVVLSTGIEDDAGRMLLVPLDLPADRWVDLVLDPADLPGAPPPLPPGRLFFDVPAGHSAKHANLVAGDHTVFGAESGVEIEAPCHVRLDVPGLVILEADITGGGDHRLAWGKGVLELRAFGPDGERVEAVVWLDGHLYRTHEGRLDLAGLEPGPREVIVSPTTAGLRGVVVSLTVAAEGPTEAEVRFTRR